MHESKGMKHIEFKTRKPELLLALVLLALGAQFPAKVAQANGAYGTNTNLAGRTISVPTYFANSPQGLQPAWDPATSAIKTGVFVDTGTPLRKFVDPLGGAYNGLETVNGMSDLAAGIPVAIPEPWRTPAGVSTGDDYYEVAVVEYTEQMHSDLPKATRLRGYVQIETPAIAAGLKDVTGLIGSEHVPGVYPDGTPIKDAAGNQVFFVHKPHYLGPSIVAFKGKPVRMKVTNYLPYTKPDGTSVGSWNGNGGEFYLPVDETIAGGGPVLDANGQQVYAKDERGNPVLLNGKPVPIKMAQNRAAVHWHGGDSPWISDGTPHQWWAPAGDISYTIGIDAAHPYGMGKGVASADVPDMPASGPGVYTLYFPNNLSGRFMMYHDHTSGLTKLNAYTGMAAGYIVVDLDELALVNTAIKAKSHVTTGGNNYAGTGLPLNNGVDLPVGLLDTVGIPLVIQDKTFVPKNIGPNAVALDGYTPQSQDAKWDLTHWGQPGDLYFPHVYETNQDPNSFDGTNPVGRWDWGPWFWPVFPAQFSLPSGAYGDVTATPEAFGDTAMVNGKAYPTMTVDPKTYRFRILSIGNDRTLNLGLYQAVDAAGRVCNASNRTPRVAPTAPGGTVAPATCTEVKMVPALPTAGFPANWPTDGRVGGVPDPATAGPDIVQIGNEAGLLPVPAVWKSQPVNYDYNVRNITMLNILQHDLLLAGGERADVLIDFSRYAGQTLLLYNDAPSPMPANDPRVDYYTGRGDQTDAGGAHDTLPGYGPNTRTIMQIKVSATNASGSGGALDVAALAAAMPRVYARTQPPPIIPQAAYNVAFGTSDGNNYAAIGTGSGGQGLTDPIRTFNYKDASGASQSLPVINKAIQELFDPIFGRMNATLAVELPFSTATIATTIPLAYIDVPVERLDAIKDGETQIWKVTHNGVDGHPVHFHMVNVQVINRVGWDGTIKPPEANEVGWKETLRMNPLEDVYVAVKAKRPVTPFGLPRSARLLDPSQEVDSTLGFTNIDPTTGQAPLYQERLVNGVTTKVSTNGIYSNQLADFDNEYVWHCHILGHEEQDFMRPFIFHPLVLKPDAPAAVAVSSGGVVSWKDTTPFGGQDADGIPTAGTNTANPEPTSSPKNEVGFKVYRGTSLVANLPANTTSWNDSNFSSTSGDYTVVAWNAKGDSPAGKSATPTSAGALVGTGSGPTGSGATAGTAVVSAVTGPSGLTQRLNSDGSVRLTWTAVAGATSYIVSVDAGAANGFNVTVAGNLTRYTVAAASLAPGVNHSFSVTAMTLSGATGGSATTVYNGTAYPPVAFAAAAGPGAGVVTLNWANDVRNVNNVTGLTLTWTQAGNTVSMTFGPKTTGATVIGLIKGRSYSFQLVANSRTGSSVPTAAVSVTAL